MDQHDLNIFMKRYGIVFVMLGMFVILMFASPNFLKTNNLINILVSVSINGVLALAWCLSSRQAESISPSAQCWRWRARQSELC